MTCLYHDWTKWEELETIADYYLKDDIELKFQLCAKKIKQQKRCNKCGQTKTREIIKELSEE